MAQLEHVKNLIEQPQLENGHKKYSKLRNDTQLEAFDRVT